MKIARFYLSPCVALCASLALLAASRGQEKGNAPEVAISPLQLETLPDRSNPVHCLPEFLTVTEARRLAQAEQQRGTSPVTGRTEMNEVRLTFRALIEQVRLLLRDGRRLIRRLIAVCETSTRSSRVQMTGSPAPLVSVPLVVLRPTTEREQIELNDLAQTLSAEGYQVARHGPQWIVYTKITERRKSLIGRSPHDERDTAAMSDRVRSGSLRQCRGDDRPH